MNERTIFMTALEKETSEQRSAFLDEVCAGDNSLRQRVEALLRSHEQAGSFLGQPAPERLAAVLEKVEGDAETQSEAPDQDADGEALDFLTPTEKPGVLGELGHYDVLEVIGRGGMGIVLRAFDNILHRVVAIKVMAPQLATSAIARKRFKREAQAAAAVSHDHVVTIHGVDEARLPSPLGGEGPGVRGLPYLVMQFVSGMSLQERINHTGPLELAEIVRIGMQTASGLAAAHAQGLIHRDIKPANILLENGIERVKITDFGLARVVDDASLTQSGTVSGTPQYMSPEQAEGGQIDQRTDLFSLGSVLYAMCTGRPPFRAASGIAVLKRVCEETPRPIREMNPDIPDWLVAIIDKLHAKNPADRYQTAAEVTELLNQHLAHLQHPSVMPLPVTKLPKPSTVGRNRLVAALALLSLIAGVIVLTVALTRPLTPDDTLGTKDGQETKTPPAPAPKPDPHPFVVFGSKGVFERKFDTLAEAVQGASDGDTIEIRGNGPFVSDGVKIRNHLVIRAGAGYLPSITLSQTAADKNISLLSISAPLVLEGLELRRIGGAGGKVEGRLPNLIHAWASGALYLANCRLIFNSANGDRTGRSLLGAKAATLTVQNCELIGTVDTACAWHYAAGGRCYIENCLVGIGGIRLSQNEPDLLDVSMHVCGNTFVGDCITLQLSTKPNLPDKIAAVPPIQLDFSRNVACCQETNHKWGVLFFHQFQIKDPLSLAEAESVLPQLVALAETQNVYQSGTHMIRFGVDWKVKDSLTGRDLADWNLFWGHKKTGSVAGDIRFQGGDLVKRALTAPEQLTPEDFRLHPDSPGHQAGKDGKDLGADVDLVGPGPAYERWKKTPEYQQWLKDTGQKK